MSGHDHEHDEHLGCEEEQTFILTDEQGVDHEMIMVLTFDTEDATYAVLLDKNDPEADGLIFRIEEENDEAYLVGIEDDEEWNKVAAIYNEIVASEREEA